MRSNYSIFFRGESKGDGETHTANAFALPRSGVLYSAEEKMLQYLPCGGAERDDRAFAMRLANARKAK